MGCILKTRNPIKGTFHTSLVGYMLTDVGVDQNVAVDYLKANKGVSEKDNDWGFLKSNNYNSDFSEPDVRYALQLLSGVGKIDELDWMEEAQNFYDSKNMSLDDEYSLEDILNTNHYPIIFITYPESKVITMDMLDENKPIYPQITEHLN
jgi:hypothetical protein